MASEYLKSKYRDIRPDKPVELTPEQKRANWWHYHKWHVLLGAGLLLVTGYLLARALGFGEVKPDYQVAYVGSAALPEDTAATLESALVGLGEDCNGDGRVVVRLNQYVTETDVGGEAAMYAYAGSTMLMADLESCESYFFLLEDPESFQRNYQVLRRLDGSNPADNDHDVEACCLSWAECPALRGLDLGSYHETVLGQELSGDSQELLSGLSLARRGFWTEKTTRYVDECDTLWNTITKGALW